MRRLVLGFLAGLILLLPNTLEAQTSTSTALPVVQEEDASPQGRFRTYKFSNGSLTDNGDGSVSIASAGGGSPGGSDTQVQFNDGGAFGGDSGLTFNKTTNELTGDDLVASNNLTGNAVFITSLESIGWDNFARDQTEGVLQINNTFLLDAVPANRLIDWTDATDDLSTSGTVTAAQFIGTTSGNGNIVSISGDLTVSGDATVAGNLYAGVQTYSHSGSATLTLAQVRGAVHYTTGAATLTLPAVADGDSLTVITIGAVAVSVKPNASDLLILDGTALDDGDKATNTSTTGDLIVLTFRDATGWYAVSGSNDGDPWTDTGA